METKWIFTPFCKKIEKCEWMCDYPSFPSDIYSKEVSCVYSIHARSLSYQAHLLFFLLHLEMEPPKAIFGGKIRSLPFLAE